MALTRAVSDDRRRMQLVERSKFVPHDDTETPIPDWKRMRWSQDRLPKNDPARK